MHHDEFLVPVESMVMVEHLPYQIDESTNRNHYYENHWKRVALNCLARHAGDLTGLSLLDYGCGRGETLAYAKAMGLEVSGLDTDPACVKLSSQHGPTALLDPSRPEVFLPTRSVDVITCFHVLEHVDNPKRVLTLLGQAARRYVVVAVPNLLHIPNLRRPRRPPANVNEGHLQSWDHAHFRNLAEKHCGLTLIDWATDATIVPVVSELIRRLLGEKPLIRLETGFFARCFPYWGISVIALLKPTATNE